LITDDGGPLKKFTPEDGFVCFLDYYAELGYEFSSWASPTSGAIVCCYTGSGSKELISKYSGLTPVYKFLW